MHSLSITQAVKKLKDGEIIGIPTETVYGLGASILSDTGLKSIFEAKKRPLFDPLIVHVSGIEMARQYCLDWNQAAEKLANTFWPGPLTMVLPKNDKISTLITSGLPTVGLRCPRHPLTLNLISQLKAPIAAPSANPFKKTSPTSVEHFEKYFPELCYLDGGPATLGIESTIISLEKSPDGSFLINILRPGHISKEQIASCLTGVSHQFIDKESTHMGPGQMQDHYMPDLPLIVQKATSQKSVVDQFLQEKEFKKIKYINLGDDPLMVARSIYGQLHQVGKDTTYQAVIIIKKENMSGELWDAIWDRINKASSFQI